ncbi:nucleoside triphosphatase YtkD [Bacillus aquiflavi]|uniref:Nucleoside triphosphatase YtkD n=1 Tax=Bacillus aquiflavi TaxID=2672567 RepID=A0A6B3VTD7_9BACI|nr:nucleoside triphosphatase YtkD [Bacillus aquiflavi]MBA4536882.1 nucleoside triphosphatase YtkD [Bacillus aquiflavi]NEY81249.1 nucleoside triphosphatase YtkD [Bacillus aquiflavi]
MESFVDANGATVQLAFEKDSFAKQAEHVFIISAYQEYWLLTDHKKRGLEFPGGKKEKGETLEGAARREVKEETGANIKNLVFLGEYKVDNGETSFVKAIYYAVIEDLNRQTHYFETNGPVFIRKDELLTIRFDERFSFNMKDDVISKSIEYIKKLDV